MKYTYRVYVFCVLLLVVNSISANNIKNKVFASIKDSITSDGVPFATVIIRNENNSKEQYETTDVKGNVNMYLSEGKYHMVISCLGYKTIEYGFNVEKTDVSLGNILMPQNSIMMKEVVVTERRKLIKLTGNGIEYDLSKDQSVQSINLLYALRNVPMLNVDATGEITVKGSKDYSIYLNGKPYRIAQTDPKAILQSIPASTISKIEVITRQNAKYDAEDGRIIINIITSHTLDGYTLTVNSSGDTKPRCNGGVSFVGGLHKVTLSVGYNYDLDSQNGQPIYRDLSYMVLGQPSQSIAIEGSGDARWNNHTFRMMMNYEIDSINSIYADGHGLLKSTNENTTYRQTSHETMTADVYSLFKTKNNYSTGTAETNIIYRNLYRKSKKERLTVGYRYTYNPDKRDCLSYETLYDNFKGWDESLDPTSRNHRKNSGGLSEHTILADYLFELNRSNNIEVGAKHIFRLGSSSPEYYLWDTSASSWTETLDAKNNMRYTQNISGAYISYSASLAKVEINAGVRGEKSWTKMRFPNKNGYDFSNNHFNVIPRGSISYSFNDQSQLELSYSTRIGRPYITALNPFENSNSSYSNECGNPNLKNEYSHNVSLNYELFTNKLNVFSGLEFTRTNDAILNYNTKEEGSDKITYTYGNIGKITKAGGNIYVSYSPVNMLSLTASYDAYYYGMRSSNYGLRQNSFTYDLMLMCNLNLKHRWSASCNCFLFKQIPEPWSSNNAIPIYSMSVYKGFMKGDLNVGLVLKFPFSKYTKLINNTVKDNFSESQVNYMTAFAVGVNVSYTLRSKKQVKIKRDNIIGNDDINTGVK